jgi:hypothetical protein
MSDDEKVHREILAEEEGIEKNLDGSSGAWKFFLALFLIAIFIMGFYGYDAFRSQPEDMSYNGFPFAQSAEGFWVTQLQIDGQIFNIPFYYHPTEVVDIKMQTDAVVPLLTDVPQEIVVSISPNATSRVVIGGIEFSRLTGFRYNMLNIPTSSALSAMDEGGADFPVATCLDANENKTVIQFIPGNETIILRDGPCIRLFYETEEDAIRVGDRLAYRILKVAY